MFEHGMMHLVRSPNQDSFDAVGRIERDGPAHQNHAGPAPRGRLGHGITHLAGGAIGEIANWIEILAGGPRGDQNGFSFEVSLYLEGLADRPNDGFDSR